MRLLIAFFTLLFLIGTAMATEEPKYNVIKKSAPFELRAYAPKIIAETTLSGDLDDASSAGFRLIADYIFGNNAALADGKILDPENGKVYNCKMKLNATGDELEVCGYIGISLIGRSQIWKRIE